MHKRAEEVWRLGALVGFDAAFALEVDVSIGASFAGVNRPDCGGGVVLQAELGAILPGWRRAQANDPQSNALLGPFGRWL